MVSSSAYVNYDIIKSSGLKLLRHAFMKSLPRSTAKEVFSHLLAIVTLYVGVISFITLLFQYINVKFPDALNFYYAGSLNMIRGAMAALIVVWPCYLLLTWFINKERRADVGAESSIRKWLLYLTLFATAIAMIVDLITLVNYFLNGEITVRFILKVLVVLITVGAVFWYELWELKHGAEQKTNIYKTAAIASVVVLIGTIVSGFLLVGSPSKQRQVRFDDQRISDLSTIQYEVMNSYQQKQELPATLADLTNNINGFSAPVDPETKTAYEYNPTGALTFNLCATSSQSTTDTRFDQPRAMYEKNWDHPAGRVCFDRTIDPALYPPLGTTTIFK